METARLVIAGCFGLVVGSFLNVVVWRLPRGESVVSPPSHCPGCDTPIRWFDNLPVLSWLLLRGRCRACRNPISWRYPLVEAATGALFVLAAWRFDDLPTTILVAVALAALLAISLIDWELKIIPDRISKPGIALGILLAPLSVGLGRLHPAGWLEGWVPSASGLVERLTWGAGRVNLLDGWSHALAGALVGGGVIYAIRVLGYLAFRKEAMGLGDVKLLAMVGALIGPLQVVYALVLACFGGALIGILRLLATRGKPQRVEGLVSGAGADLPFDRALLGPDAIEVGAPAAPPSKGKVSVRLLLPAAGILEDEDVELALRARVVGGREHRGAWIWRLEPKGLSEEDGDRLAMMAASWRYVPFGPFLALGGAASLLFGDAVHWLVTVGYPEWMRGVLGG